MSCPHQSAESRAAGATGAGGLPGTFRSGPRVAGLAAALADGVAIDRLDAVHDARPGEVERADAAGLGEAAAARFVLDELRQRARERADVAGRKRAAFSPGVTTVR